jgi:phosphatidylserine/phosphatidylglycerophosphate/cardiolipin synthase-like enzyme
MDIVEVYFSPGDECLKAILHYLRHAKREVKICVFTITDNRISDAIKDCYKRGVAVKIITDNDKSFDKGSDIWEFDREDIQVRVDRTTNHMHHKFAVIDDVILITGSYNWTRSAEKYNQENVVVIRDKKAIKKFEKEFDRLWRLFFDYKR